MDEEAISLLAKYQRIHQRSKMLSELTTMLGKHEINLQTFLIHIDALELEEPSDEYVELFEAVRELGRKMNDVALQKKN